jgi:hypothetical protein
MRFRLLAGAAGAGVLALLVGGVAVIASIPDSAGMINGCYKSSNGQLRVIDSATQQCASGETAISWNQVGRQGIQGPQGASGATGATGAIGATGATGAAGVAGTPGANGAAGATGAQGAPGAAGADGATGPQGVQGPQGVPGLDNNTVGVTGVPGGTGPQGPAGASGYSLVIGPQLDLCTVPGFPGDGCDVFGPTEGVSVAVCPSGTKALGGGYWIFGNIGAYESEPDSTGQLSPVGIAPDGNGWTVAAALTGVAHTGSAQAYAICATAS